jgi:hypothetical protein
MDDCWHAGVRLVMASGETDRELGLRTASGRGVRARQAGRVKLPWLAVLHPPARRGHRTDPGASHRNGPRPGSAARGGLRGRGPGRLARHAGRLPSALPGPRPGSGAARGRHDHLRGTWRLPGDHHPGGVHHAPGRPRRGAAGPGRLPRVAVPRRTADPRRRRARTDHRAGAHAVLGTRSVPVDTAAHAHRLRPGGQPDDQLPAVREVARRRPNSRASWSTRDSPTSA